MMTLQQLLPDMALSARHAQCCVQGMRLDSRRVRDGDLFVALGGARQDGRRFIEAAIHAGAVAVLTESDKYSEAEQGGVPVIGMPSLSAGLVDLAMRFHRNPMASLSVLGVTGTNGKSSVAWFLRDAMNAVDMPCGLIGTLGAHYGDYHDDIGHTTPDTLTLHESLAAFRDRGARYVAMEVSSHALAQDRLAGVSVNIAAFTNLSRDHLDYHGDMDGYFAAKSRLFHGHAIAGAVINTGDRYGARLAAQLADNIRCVRVGGKDADIFCTDVQLNADGMSARISVAGESLSLQLPLYGRFNIDNLMIVAGMLAVQGLAPNAIGAALSAVTPVPGRMQPVLADDAPVVLVDYAHTPDALEKSLHAVREHFTGKIWCVVGCGGNRDTGKRPQMAAVAEQLADQLIFTADNPRDESVQEIIGDMLAGVQHAMAVQVIDDRREAVRTAVLQAAPGDVVLVAGKGHEHWQEIGAKKLPMDDVSLAREALHARHGGGQ
ncbi:UDP-N-acetylmuramoyl-L-alanyl-D-glutamate--2,6-diaminopimelate ligase [Alcanivorax sp. 1008]|uniref:UDP-N-acetylmuramoyl-L-alanyl-D-glutamate--2, 6-diaminopimelate ligase n=1 Tax=Alcanivorax sp. 1008 TaxID=2816853 RepID=UPI001DABFA7B|nr:UDP-N-acetylmuramoyl-L-alanyl-D-glutamate--2,6-diaminopimelate ligase [Alcanivorax sp. 1008]MCC1495267.1 UDP-N-acetylmuramoyl-L-alanyl-D-glutamate--2,6-diaminopimelate ligase [Alcanivorax sp. 1008]